MKEKTDQLDLRTEAEIEREVRNQRICERWSCIYDPTRGSRNRYLCILAKEFGLSTIGIKDVLKSFNLYPSK